VVVGREKNKMKTQEFDYYIYIDFSENLIGYTIIEKSNVKEIISKIVKFDHYSGVKHKKEYLRAIKLRFEKENILSLLYRCKICEMRSNLEIFVDIIDFIRKNDNCIIFLSIDNQQYDAFLRIMKVMPDKKNILILRESQIVRGTLEYRLSLIIDNMLNLERVRRLNDNQK